MRTVLLQTLRESYNRRMGLVLLIVSALVPVLYMWFAKFVTQPDGNILVYVNERLQGPATRFVPNVHAFLLNLAGSLWIMIGAFAAAPLLTSHMEKGWVDLLLSKGVSRWQVFLGRWLGALVVYLVCLSVMTGVTALYFWARSGIAPARFLTAVALLACSFAALSAMMALISMASTGPAIPITFVILYLPLSNALAGRKNVLYPAIKAEWAHWLIDWVYRILPKTQELSQMASMYLISGTVKDWWPLWSSGLFIIGALALTGWFFHRKSF